MLIELLALISIPQAFTREIPKTDSLQLVHIDRLEAAVGDTILFTSDIQNFRRTQKLRLQIDPLISQQLHALGPGVPDSQIVEFLLDQTLIAHHFPKTDAEVEAAIHSIEISLHVDRPQLLAELKRENVTFADYFELIRASASNQELIDREIRPKVSISEDDLKNYFFNHYAKSEQTPQAYHLRLIQLVPDQYKSPAAARQVLEAAYSDLKKGEAFVQVAQRLNEGEAGQSGGDLGILTTDQLTPELNAQVRKLKPGQFSDIFATPGFFGIVFVEAITTADQSAYLEKKEEIRQTLSLQEFRKQIQIWLARTRQTDFVHRAGQKSYRELPLKQ